MKPDECVRLRLQLCPPLADATAARKKPCCVNKTACGCSSAGSWDCMSGCKDEKPRGHLRQNQGVEAVLCCGDSDVGFHDIHHLHTQRNEALSDLLHASTHTACEEHLPERFCSG